MRYGWERPNDTKILDIVINLLERHPRLSLIELGSGTTWSGADKHFGVPGLSRILKDALPNRINVTVTDRNIGFDLFIKDYQGRLIHSEFKDDRPPRMMQVSALSPHGTLTPARSEDILAARKADQEFPHILTRLGHTYDFNPDDSRNAIFIRPRIDAEIEALLYGVRALPGINYLHLLEDLKRHGELARFDFVFARHLCPVFLPSRIQHLKDTLPEVLESCARHSFVQFDQAHVPGDPPADLVFRHHELLP
jgi:hypothetical protein